MKKEARAWRGIVAGIAGGLAAAWVMNVFMAGPGQALQQAVQTEEEERHREQRGSEPKEDATMKAADAIAHAATGEHLTRWETETGGPIVHYCFGALTGAMYGGLAEYSGSVTAGCGTSFGGNLFGTADLLAVPALNLGPAPTTQPPPAQASPFAAHLVYGVSTELVRGLVRMLL